MLCLDAKVTLDENAGFRHPDHEEFEDKAAADPLEQRAKEKNLNYVKLDGNVGIIGNGAGLVMSTLDVVAYSGEESAAGRQLPRHRRWRERSGDGQRPGDRALRPGVRSVFVNVFGGITACDEVANGIVQALDLLKQRGEDVSKPLVVRLDGNNAEEGRRILDGAGNPLIERVDTMDGAARRAAELAASGV